MYEKRHGTWKRVSLQDADFGRVTEYLWIEYTMYGKTHERLIQQGCCDAGETTPVYLLKAGHGEGVVWVGVICWECKQCTMVRTLPENHAGEKRALATALQQLGYLADYPHLTDCLTDVRRQKQLQQAAISSSAQVDFTHKPKEKRQQTANSEKMPKHARASKVKTIG